MEPVVQVQATTADETKEVTISGGEIAGNARKELEAKLGRTVISSSNAAKPGLLDDSKK